MGSLDEEDLIGRKDESNAWEDEVGRHVPRIGGWGMVLCTPRYHLFAENEIPGVADGFVGEKWLLNKKDGRSFRGRVRYLRQLA